MLSCVPLAAVHVLKSWSPVLQNVAKFGDRVLKEVIK